MELLSDSAPLPGPPEGRSIVTWGVFDGVHRGHRKIIGAVAAWARRGGDASVAVTFNRHPKEALTGKPFAMLLPLDERLRLLGECGVDHVLLLDFTEAFSGITAERFVQDILLGRLRTRGVVFGHDSRFGCGREGDEELLARHGLEVRHCPPEKHHGRPVSSSLVRHAILEGRMADAAALLGRLPSVFGTVRHGMRRGIAMGFPTANLEKVQSLVFPPSGVYAAEVPLDGVRYQAVVSIGSRPTFQDGGTENVEAYLLDYKGGDLYGRALEVRFRARMRDELRFKDAEALRRRIQEDVANVRKLPV